MFSWLPAPGERLSNHVVWNGADFDFYGANLERKYGAQYKEAWKDVSLRRLKSWGYNTVGNWSEPFVGNNKVPYVVPAWVDGSHARLSAAGGSIPDPYDPQFAADTASFLSRLDKKIASDKFCLGYFVDNELNWSRGDSVGGRLWIAYAALASPTAASPAKRAYMERLRARYPAIEQLNAAWGTSFSSWGDLEKPYDAPQIPSSKMEGDFTDFVRAFAEQYFKIVKNEIRKTDANHLYLGCRFASYNTIVVDAAAKYCDVVSFNIYAPSIDPQRWDFVNRLNKPCVIGEFHFGARDRGMFSPGLVDAGSQKGRAELYRKYVDSVLTMPAFAGCHWFQYEDEPLTGRFDGENYNIGLVDVTDTPYPEFVEAVRNEHMSVYNKRYYGENVK
jgi:hypothetical protein